MKQDFDCIYIFFKKVTTKILVFLLFGIQKKTPKNLIHTVIPA